MEKLDGIKNYAAGIFVLQNSTLNGLINILSYLKLQELPDNYLTDYVSNVFALTPEEVPESEKISMREEDMTLVFVGDRGRISKQVAPYLKGHN